MLRTSLRKIGKVIPDGKMRNIMKRAYKCILYLLNDAIYTSDFDLFVKKVKKIQKYSTKYKYWTEMKEWNFSDQQDRYNIMVAWLNKRVIPLLNKDSVVADLACANGEFSFMFAKYVKAIDGFDLSENMIELAKRTSKEMNITNVTFQQADAQTITLPNDTYDCFMMFGLAIYIIDDTALDRLLKKIYQSMKTDSYLVIKDYLWTIGGGICIT